MRARDPIPGLRQKLRQKIRDAGFSGAFSTDLIRSHSFTPHSQRLKVTIKKGDPMELPLECEGYEVFYCWPKQ